MANFAALIIDAGGIRQVAAGDVLTAPNFKDTALTSGRIVQVSTGGLLVDEDAFRIANSNLYYQRDKNDATLMYLRNWIALGNTLAFAAYMVEATGASGYLGAFPSDYATAALRDYVVVGANSDAAGLIIRAPVSRQTIIFYAGSNAIEATMSATGLALTHGLQVGDGSIGVPSLSFASDTDTGIYRFAENFLAIVVGGAHSLTCTPAYLRPYQPIQGVWMEV